VKRVTRIYLDFYTFIRVVRTLQNDFEYTYTFLKHTPTNT